MNNTLWVGNVPTLVATFFFFTKEPAMASVAIIGTNLTNNMINPILTFMNIVLAPKPAKADPLFPPAEE